MWGPTNLDGVVKRILRFVFSEFGFLESDDGSPVSNDPLCSFETTEQDTVSEACFEERKARLVRKVTVSFIRECLDLDISRLNVPAPYSVEY
jgi:hypothetical protein